MSYTIKQTFRVEVGHRTWTQNMLTSRGHEFYDGSAVANKCANIHGHTLFVSVTLEGHVLDDQYFLMDTDLIGGAFRPIFDEIDHAFIIDRSDPLFPRLEPVLKEGQLKYVAVDFSPTFEALVRYLHDRLQQALAELGQQHGLWIKEMRLMGEQTVEATYTAPTS
ncbi:6-pyruvoyl tetrahydropterin synthase family protein [Streptomyces sp. NPDC058701]|uniref:6-pyruvoyl trahydropterin synthase family protein n=1 Tax=Streptomyces sp. NPDC058701 TaxID=3346608 RepID=UPI00364CFD42